MIWRGLLRLVLLVKVHVVVYQGFLTEGWKRFTTRRKRRGRGSPTSTAIVVVVLIHRRMYHKNGMMTLRRYHSGCNLGRISTLSLSRSIARSLAERSPVMLIIGS